MGKRAAQSVYSLDQPTSVYIFGEEITTNPINSFYDTFWKFHYINMIGQKNGLKLKVKTRKIVHFVLFILQNKVGREGGRTSPPLMELWQLEA